MVQLIDRAVLVGRITLDNLVIVHDTFRGELFGLWKNQCIGECLLKERVLVIPDRQQNNKGWFWIQGTVSVKSM